jgi:hypothetical protein
MTALTLKADLAGSCRDVSCVPLAAVSNRSKSSALLDHLVGEREQPVRNLEAEGLGSLEVDYQLIFRRLLHVSGDRQRAMIRPFARDVFPYVFGCFLFFFPRTGCRPLYCGHRLVAKG